MERRALYNSLRMGWLIDRNQAVESWQVDDYRLLTPTDLFARLALLDVHIDKNTFVNLSDDFESPEELTDSIANDHQLEGKVSDQLYLLLFELWRRFVPEKMSLSLFCDELDHQIFLYDTAPSQDNHEALEYVINNLQILLDENVDAGGKPHEVFARVCEGCANHVENYLYDYTAEQIDGDNIPYAAELLDGFEKYVTDKKWFSLLRARVLGQTEGQEADILIKKLLKDSKTAPELDFLFEVLEFLVQGGNPALFIEAVKLALHHVKQEEDLQEILNYSIDYFHCLDREEKEAQVLRILEARKKYSLEALVKPSDPAIAQLLALFR